MRLGLGLGIGSNSIGELFSLVDVFPDMVAAYSLYDLKPDVPRVIRVRRDSDNAESDFTAKEISDGTLESFCAGTDGLVVTWYDQSGNGNDATQGAATSQPKIISNGSFIIDNEYPFIQYDSSDDNLGTSFTATGTMLMGGADGGAFYEVTVSGAYNFLGSSPTTDHPIKESIRVIWNRTLNAIEQLTIKSRITYSNWDFSDVTDFERYWRQRSELTSFPLVDTSNGVNFNEAWALCSITSLPQLDFSNGTTFVSTWRACTNLTSFPAVNFNNATTFNKAWSTCVSLQDFPANMFDSVTATDFTEAFFNTNLTQTSIDNILVSLDTAGQSNGTFNQSGGSAPSITGINAADRLMLGGWDVDVTGGYQGPLVVLTLMPFKGTSNNTVRVRRDSDNAELDFTATEINDGTLINWVGVGNNGYVVTWYDQSGNNYHASQSIATSQPKIVDNGNLIIQNGHTIIKYDGNDDNLTITGLTATGSMAMAGSIEGEIYEVAINGNYNLLANAFYTDHLLNESIRIIWNRTLSADEQNAIKSKVTYSDWGFNSSTYRRYWRGRSELTSFPLINTSTSTTFQYAWGDCTSLTSFPLIDTSSGSDFNETWINCSSLTSFPLLDVSNGVGFGNTWRGCSSLTSFPALNVSKGNDFFATWYNCTSLQDFPPNMFDSVTATRFTLAFANTNLTQTSIDNILVSLDTAGQSGGTFDQSGGSAPSSIGEAAIDNLIIKNWNVAVTGGYLGKLLTNVPGAIAAFGTFDITTTANNVYRLRRDNDNAERDFTSVEKENGTLEAWVGAGNNAYVVRWYDQTGNNNNFVQNFAAAQPMAVENGVLLKQNGYDVVDFSIGSEIGMNIYNLEPVGTMLLGDNVAGEFYEVDYTGEGATQYFIRNGGGYTPYSIARPKTPSIFVFWNRTLSTVEKDLVKQLAPYINYDGFSSITDYTAYLYNFSAITEIPQIDTSNGIIFDSAFQSLDQVTSFSGLDFSNGTSFKNTWYRAARGINDIDVSSGVDFTQAFAFTTDITSFPPLNMSSGLNFSGTWNTCQSLTSFPANMFDTCIATNFTSAFNNTNLNQTSIDNILVSIDTAGQSNGTFGQSGGSAPSATGIAAIVNLRARGWTITVTGGY